MNNGLLRSYPKESTCPQKVTRFAGTERIDGQLRKYRVFVALPIIRWRQLNWVCPPSEKCCAREKCLPRIPSSIGMCIPKRLDYCHHITIVSPPYICGEEYWPTYTNTTLNQDGTKNPIRSNSLRCRLPPCQVILSSSNTPPPTRTNRTT